MEKFSFLFKPLFYISSLLFSCWMVFKIEHISPSDFGKYKSLFEVSGSTKDYKEKQKKETITLKDLYGAYKRGVIDSAYFFYKLEKISGYTSDDHSHSENEPEIVQK